MKFKYLKITSIIFTTLIIQFAAGAFSFAQQKGEIINSDSLHQSELYRKAEGIQDGQQRINAFKDFVSTFPNSQLLPNALMELFSIYLDNNELDTALVYAGKAVQLVPEQNRIPLYNDAAYALALKKTGLDTALIYAQRAVLGASKTLSAYLKYRAMSLDTKALVMFDLGYADSAAVLEEDALSVNKDNPAFLSSLAVYQEASGKRMDALKTAAKAILLGNTDEAFIDFNKWIEKERPEKKEQYELRKVIADSLLKEYFQKTKRENKFRVNSTAAAFLACMGVDLTQANKWIDEALGSLNDYSLIPDRVLFTKNHGIILFAEGKYKEALEVLKSVENLADTWNTEYWYTLGKTYEKVKESQKALDAYISGCIVSEPFSLQSAMRELGIRAGISNNKIKTLILQRRDELSSFEPGHYSGKKLKGNAVLAELFTGADCMPCQSADYAFDDLSEYFKRSDVAILVYHLHIPKPDPMTNPDSFKRYTYYGGNFGTPTVFIQGAARIDGGGQKVLTKNKFELYKYSIGKFLDKNTGVKLTGSVKWVNESVSVNLRIMKERAIDNNPVLHIALAEKSINYTGANGVKKHIFVVRNLFNSIEGTPIKSNKGDESISAVFNVAEIQTGISKYLNDPTKDPSWPGAFVVYWPHRTDKIDKKNLAVVAWVQDSKTKEVLQSIYLDVPVKEVKVGVNK